MFSHKFNDANIISLIFFYIKETTEVRSLNVSMDDIRRIQLDYCKFHF